MLTNNQFPGINMFQTFLRILLSNQNHAYHTINPTFELQNNFNHEITLNHINKLYDKKLL